MMDISCYHSLLWLVIAGLLLTLANGEKNCLAGQFGWDCQLACHCAGSDQCNTNNGDCPGDCAEGWMGPKCQLQTENVSKDKPASQTDTKAGNEAKFAVDGVIDQKSNYSHAMTKVDNSTVWWEVDLGKIQKIRVIKVYFAEPETTFIKRLRGASLKVFNSTEADAVGDLCYQDTSGPNGTPPTNVTLTNCSSGSVVRLYNSRNTAQDLSVYSRYPQLLITEVQVIADKGCAQGSYGSECEKVCGRCQDKSCNRDDGACGECLPGWYGNDCQQQCSSSCPNKKCDKNTGHCTEPCAFGFYGNLCNETCSKKCLGGCESDSGKCVTCPLYQYGDLCEQNCSTNCKATNCTGRICNRDSGHCSCGCKDKTFGDTCEGNCPSNCIQCDNFDSCFTCEPEYWGKQCETPCSIDCLNQRCDKDSGKCYGCDGFKYGDMCETECPSNCEGNQCYQNGTCQKGCTDQSYYGNRCDIRCNRTHPSCKECRQNSTGDIECSSCVDGRHGLKCELICPKNCANCRNDSLCTQCEMGFTGELCDTPCGVQNCSECNINGTCRVCLPGLYGHRCKSKCADCETCVPNVSKTKGYSCLSCKKGEFLYESGRVCFACDDHCESCFSWTNCTSCKDGYHGTSCSHKCPENCVSCLSDKECTKCNTSWTGTVCQCNMKHCITDSDQSKWCREDGTCLKGCLKGFYGDRCQYKCARNCLSCEQKGGKCLECAAGQYGADCRENCSANCAEKDVSGAPICRFSNGSCNFCDAGWFGGKCDVPCNKNCRMSGGIHACHQKDGTCESCEGDKYGPSCNLDCAQNCHDRFGVNSCYKSDGSCRSCADGFHGAYCNNSCSGNCKTSCKQVDGDCDECVSGYYGKVCENHCPSNCGRGVHSKMIVCNRFTGECLFCKEGYYGEICNLQCSQFCTQGTSKPACKKADGHCLSCQPGYHGNFCNGECNENCGIADDSDVKVGLCDRNSSHCLHGCANGWYNNTCLDRCNSKCRGEKCQIDDGKCSDGCVSGYRGDFCSLLVQPEDSATAGIVGGIIAALVVVVAVMIIFILLRRRYFGKPVRKGNNTRVHKRAVKNGITSDEIIPLYANVNGANRLPLPARNTTKAGVEEEVLADGDDTTPLMGSDRKASDYYNLSSLIPVAGFADYVHGRQVLTADWYKDDFAKLPRGLLKNCMVAVSPANRGKCRYKNLYPYDDSRVILEPDGNEKTDFINASYIHGYQKKEAFIAAQGPTEQNVNDFWRMIWQKDCGKIVMLTNLYEDCKIKCVKYWPDEKETDQYGNLDVEIVGEEVFSDYTQRLLKVSHKRTREEKDFIHFHFTAWPDRGVPENAGALLHFRDKVNEASGVPDGPILVHCSAGIGRTGTFIVTDYLIRQAKAESHLDVFRTVTDMRYQRANFVQTDVQYEFVHKALIEALTTKEMEISAAEFCRYYWGLLEDRSEYSNQTKLEEQYETLNEMSGTLDESCFTSGRLPENIAKNRHPDIIPVDTYRAYLSTPVSGSNEYINAVFLPSCLNKSAFLLTQMPLPHTVTDFWRLVYDQHVSTIVMMNNVTDENDETIGEYWPSEDSTYGPFKIELLSCENHDHYCIMAMKLTYISSSRQDSMTVRQYRFESWPDGELLPLSTKALVSLTEAVNQSPKVYKDESVIVHCMNGNDRSGLFCTVSAIMSQLRTQHKVNIPQTILQLRRRRPQLIPNLEQYDFCHRAVSEHLDDTQIYSNVM